MACLSVFEARSNVPRLCSAKPAPLRRINNPVTHQPRHVATAPILSLHDLVSPRTCGMSLDPEPHRCSGTSARHFRLIRSMYLWITMFRQPEGKARYHHGHGRRTGSAPPDLNRGEQGKIHSIWALACLQQLSWLEHACRSTIRQLSTHVTACP